jgi:hypothetical protein
LFIWDNKRVCLAGGYRLGLGNEIMQNKGRKGFYTYTLYKMNPSVDSLLKDSVEIGRSFVVSDYQRKTLSLFMLWKGITQLLLRHPDLRYLIGPVSISNDYSSLSKEIMVKYFSLYHENKEYKDAIQATQSLKKSLSKKRLNKVMESIHNVDELENFVYKMENRTLPVLLKKYILLGGEIVCFNVDKNFNNSLDGFIILNMNQIPKELLFNLTKDSNRNLILNRFKN